MEGRGMFELLREAQRAGWQELGKVAKAKYAAYYGPFYGLWFSSQEHCKVIAFKYGQGGIRFMF